MKPTLVINTPFGRFERKSYKKYGVASVWLMPETGDYVAAWHLNITNVEKHDFAGRFQLLGLFEPKYKTTIGEDASAAIPYVV